MSEHSNTVAILAFPDRPRAAAPLSAAGRVFAKLDKAARYRRNTRSRDYMRSLAVAELPGATILEVDGELPTARIAAAAHVVLLWADAIGYGWTPIERAVFRSKRRGARVLALSGRRRLLELTSGTLLAFRIRRGAERLWLGEIAAAAALLLTAPALVAWDLARGRR